MKMNDPIGRVMNASAKMANDQSVPAKGLKLGKTSAGNTMHEAIA